MCYNLHSKSYQEYIIPVRTIVLTTEKNRKQFCGLNNVHEMKRVKLEIMAESL